MGSRKKEQLGIDDTINMIQELKKAGLDGSVMALALPMFRVTPTDHIPSVNVMAEPQLSDEEVDRTVKTGLAPHHTPWPMVRRPGMLPGPDYFDVVSFLSSSSLVRVCRCAWPRLI